MKKIDQAWDEKRYDEVLLLLRQDSLYPESFKYEDLKDCDSPLKNFIDVIVKLHEHVRNGDLSEVKEITSRYKSERYLNPDNQSAARTALLNKKFHIYAHLKSIGVVLDDDEKKFIDRELKIAEKKTLREILRSYFPVNDDSLISFLTLKSKSINPPENFRESMTDYYTRLNRKIPDILKVVGYENNLEVIFDHKDENAVGICGDDCYGVTLPDEKTIYLGSMRKEDETLGTLAHELTHLAMEMVFKNECKPYEITDAESENQFKEITKRIASALSHFNGEESKIIARAFTYEPAFYHSELTARVSQILTGFQNGEEWLQNNTPDLLAFYSEKVLPKCQEFISRSFLIKPRNTIKTLNEKFGEIGSLIKYGLFFENLDFLTSFLNSQTISFFITKNGRFGLLRVLQALLGKMYVNYYDNFIVFKFQDCVTFLTDIKIAFDSEATDFLLLDCASVRNSLLKDGIQEITFRLGANKKIIFVAEENQSDIIKGLSKSNSSWGLMPDENFCLNDLDSESQQKILQKEILLQGRKTNLRNLLGQKKELYKLITSDVIGHLFSDGQVEIGNKIFGISNLEGSYAQMLQKIDTASLKREIDNSDSVFVFMGDRDKLTGLNLIDEVAAVDLKNSGVINKKILWTESLEDDFKQFCQSNPLRKVHLINITGDEFLLQQIFNPDFYMKRKVRKIVMNVNNLEYSIKTNRKETFIFTGGGTLIENWKQKYSNVKTFDETKGSQNSEDVIHWIQEENGALIWKNSRGSIGKVLLASSEELSSNHLTEENELVKDIAERKIMIISDEPGMGKSTTITKLYQTPVIDKKHWIIRINLKNCLKAIRNLPSTNLTIRDVITFLQGVERNLNNTLTTLFLDLLLDPKKRISKDLLLVFDGFDELLDEKDRNMTIRLLKFLRNGTKSKVWIASRLQYKRFLERELNTFALRFDPLDNNMKREFIKKYYGDRLNLVLSEEQLDEAFHGGQLETYVENFIRKMESIFQENLSTILGTPLQLNLLLDGSTEYFLSWLKNGSDVDFSYLGDNLFQVYENFIHRKYVIYFKKKKIEEDLIQESMKASLEPYHKHLARNLLYKASLEDIEKYKPLILLIGLVQLQNENLQFFHFTFREFYSAKIIVEFLTGDGIEETNFTEAARKYLVQIFTEQQYKLIRRFIDCRIQKIGFSKIGPKVLHLIDVTYFVTVSGNSLTTMEIASDGKYSKIKQCEESGKLKLELLLYVNMSESNNSIFNLLFWCLKPLFESTFHLMTLTKKSVYYPPSLLHCAMVTGNDPICDTLLEAMEELPTRQQKQIIQIIDPKGGNILQVAEDNGCFEILMKLVQKIKSIFTLEEQKMLRCRFRNEHLLSHPIKTKNLKILNFVLKYAEEVLGPEERKRFFTQEFKTGENVLTLAVRNGDPELLQILITESGKILSEDRNKFFMSLGGNKIAGNLLFFAVLMCSSQMTKEVLRQSKEILNPQERKAFFLTEKSMNYNVLHAAFIANNFEIIDILLTEAQSFLSVNERISLFVGKTGGIDDVLISEISRKHIELVEYFLTIGEKLLLEEEQNKPFTSGTEETGMTLLLMAAIKVKAQIIDLLKGSEEKETIFFMLEEAFYETDSGSSNFLKLITKILLKEVKNIITKDKHLQFFTLGKKAVENVIFLAIYQNDVELVELLLHNEKKIILEEELKKLFRIIYKTGLPVDLGKNTTWRYLKMGNRKNKFEIARALLINNKKISSQQEMFFLFINEKEGNILHLSVLHNKAEITKNILRKSKELLSVEEKKLFFLSKRIIRVGPRNSLFVAACGYNHFQMIEILLKEAEHFLAPNERMELFLEKKKRKIDTSVFSFIIQEGMNFESLELLFEYTEKMLLTEHQENLLDYIYFRGVNAFNIFHILHYAKMYDRARTTEYILEKLGKILVPEAKELFFLAENDEQNALYISCQENDTEAVEILLKEAKYYLLEGKRLQFFKGGTGASENVLISAVQQNNVKLTEILLNSIEEILLPEEQKELLTTKSKSTSEYVLQIATRQENKDQLTECLLRSVFKLFNKGNLESGKLWRFDCTLNEEIGQLKFVTRIN